MPKLKIDPKLLPPVGTLRKMTLADGRKVVVDHRGMEVVAARGPSPQDFIAADLLDPAKQHRAAPPPLTNASGRPLDNAQQNNRGTAKEIIIGGSSPSGELKTVDGITYRVIGDLLETPRDLNEGAESLILTLGLDTTPASDANLSANLLQIFGNIQWGVGGANFFADVDWGMGTTLVLPANYIKVGATLLDTTGGPECRILLASSFAYGGMPGRGSSGARLTVNLQQPGMGNFLWGFGTRSSEPRKIPNFARSFNIIESPLPLPQAAVPMRYQQPNAYAVWFYNSDAAGAYPQGMFVKSGYTDLFTDNEAGYPIPNGAQFFKVMNLGTSYPGNASIVFNLSL